MHPYYILILGDWQGGKVNIVMPQAGPRAGAQDTCVCDNGLLGIMILSCHHDGRGDARWHRCVEFRPC